MAFSLLAAGSPGWRLRWVVAYRFEDGTALDALAYRQSPTDAITAIAMHH